MIVRASKVAARRLPSGRARRVSRRLAFAAMHARERERAAGLEDLQPAMNDERSECTRSVPSVASRRVAAPYGVDDLRLGRSISSEKRSKFSRATRACLTPDYVELATLADPTDDGHPLACKFSNPGDLAHQVLRLCTQHFAASCPRQVQYRASLRRR